MLIKSNGLANSIQYILNMENLDDIITHQINLYEKIKLIKQPIVYRFLNIYFEFVYTHILSHNRISAKIEVQFNNSNFWEFYLQNSHYIMMYFIYKNNPYYKRLTYNDQIEQQLVTYIQLWPTQNFQFIQNMVDGSYNYNYNNILKFINIYHEFSWCLKQMQTAYTQNVNLIDILDIYDTIILESTHPYEYESYIACKKLRTVFTEEFKLYNGERVIHILKDLFEDDISQLHDIKRYNMPSKPNINIKSDLKSNVFYDIIYSSRYYKFINYYLRKVHFSDKLIKPELYELFEFSHDIKKVNINESKLITNFLKEYNIYYWGNIYDSKYDNIKLTCRYNNRGQCNTKCECTYWHFKLSTELISSCIVHFNNATVNIDGYEYHLIYLSSPIVPNVKFMDYKDWSTSTVEIQYCVVNGYNHSICYKFNDKWYDKDGIVNDDKLKSCKKTIDYCIKYDKNRASEKRCIIISEPLHTAKISDFFDVEFSEHSWLIPQKQITHFYGYPVKEDKNHKLLKLKDDKKLEDDKKRQLFKREDDKKRQLFKLEDDKKREADQTHNVLKRDADKKHNSLPHVRYMIEEDWETEFDKVNKDFIEKFSPYFVPLDQRLLLFRIGKFELDFYKTDDPQIYKSACYISTSYMTSATENSPFESEYDEKNRQDIYVIIANPGILVCHVHFNSISNENEILINVDTKCIKRRSMYRESYDRIIVCIELIQ